MRVLASSVLCGMILVLFVSGCSKQDPGNVAPNIPPETVLTLAPAEGDTASYRVWMTWFGWDPDGVVTHYRVRWDTFDWTLTGSTDSTFYLSAADDTIGAAGACAYHTFLVKAIDNAGDEDPTPASVSFTAFNEFPQTEIVSTSGLGGPFAEFEWRGTDSDGEIAGYGYRLLARSGFAWDEIAAADSLGPDETVAFFGPLGGAMAISLRFEVWAYDDQWAADPSPATCDFYSWIDDYGQLRVASNVFSTLTFYTPYWSELYDATILSGDNLSFDWHVDCGAGVVEYRHAYDDTSMWAQWSAADTHFDVLPEPGQHSLYISARDSFGMLVQGKIRLDVVETTLDGYILVVDDYDRQEHLETWGTDADRSAFYDLLVAPFGDRYEWEPSEHTVNDAPQPPDAYALAAASTVVWYADGDETVLAELFDPYGQFDIYDPLSAYVRVGGNLVLCGFECIQQILGGSYPYEIDASDTTRSGRFVRDILGVGYAESSGDGFNPNSPWDYGYCFYGAVPTGGVGFQPVYIDSVGPAGWPEPGKWWLYTSDVPHLTRCGVPSVEKISSYQGAAQEILMIDSYLNQEFEGESCAVLCLSGDDHGNVCYCGFPFYYLQTPQAQVLFGELLHLFGEEER